MGVFDYQRGLGKMVNAQYINRPVFCTKYSREQEIVNNKKTQIEKSNKVTLIENTITSRSQFL